MDYMDTDANIYGWLLTANKVVFRLLFFNINFCWCNLMIPVVSTVIVGSV